MTIAVAVLGSQGRMGRYVLDAVGAASDMQVVAEIDQGEDFDLRGAQVVVDFTVPAVSESNVTRALEQGAHVVVGTTGWTDEALERVRQKLRDHPNQGVLIAPNFSLSAVLVMKFAQLAAPYFESVEVLEKHHPQKLDAPSGTAAHTAELIAQARAQAGRGASPDATAEELPGARGANVDGVRVHSVRLAGLTANLEVYLGNPGEQLLLQQDSFERSSFMPGVLLAIRKISEHPGLSVGLDNYLDELSAI